jgi:hypothetical protein
VGFETCSRLRDLAHGEQIAFTRFVHVTFIDVDEAVASWGYA